jgi:hypothetical protein
MPAGEQPSEAFIGRGFQRMKISLSATAQRKSPLFSTTAADKKFPLLSNC